MDTQEQTAAAELEQTQRGVEEVLERIKAGDEEIGPADLEAAERRVRFAQARLEGEDRRRSEEAERARLGRLEELQAQAKDLDRGELDKARQKAQKALDAYIGALVAHNTRIAELAGELEGLSPLPAGVAVTHGSYGPGVSLGGKDYRPVRPVSLVADLAREQLRAHVPGIIDLERPL